MKEKVPRRLLHANDEDVDGCLCGQKHRKKAATDDRHLPLAWGGVSTVASEMAPDGEIDGCDVDFDTGEPTADYHLPAVALGGVSTVTSETALDSEIDGCDVDFNVAEPTADQDLPVAKGG